MLPFDSADIITGPFLCNRESAIRSGSGRGIAILAGWRGGEALIDAQGRYGLHPNVPRARSVVAVADAILELEKS